MSAVNAITGYEYGGVNQATLKEGKWATFKQWQGAGYMVIKGQHGVAIMNRLSVDDDGNRKFTGYSYVFSDKQVSKIEEEVQGEQPKQPEVRKSSGKAQLRKVASQMSASYRLLHIKYGKEDWSSDGYTAINQLVQPTRKTCALEVKPDIDLTPLVPTDRYEVGTVTDDGEHKMLQAISVDIEVKVNAKWYENICNLYPNAVVKVTDKLSPVLWTENSKLVAVLMPVKQ